MTNLERIALMRKKLETALEMESLDIIDDSHLHQGHAGAASGAGHFTLKITSASLKKQSLIASHRAVYAALNDMLITEIHALSIHIL